MVIAVPFCGGSPRFLGKLGMMGTGKDCYSLRRFALIPRQARNDGERVRAVTLCGGSPRFLGKLGMMGID